MKQTFAIPLAVVFAAMVATAQPKPADPPRASALKTPDGAIVFVTRDTEAADPGIDKVILSPAEWKALQEQVDQAKRQSTGKPVAPSGCAVRVRIETRGERPVAVLTVVYSVRTTAPRTVVALGLQRAQVTAARGDGNRLPILNPPGDDGLTVLFEAAGEHALTLELEAAVGPRGRGELGFDIGLPRAVITTVAFDPPPATAAKKILVGTREGKAGELRRATVSAEDLSRPRPLGPTEILELAWEPPSPAAPAAPMAESDVVVRVDDSQVETTARVRLRGPLKEWQLALPPGAEVTTASDAGPPPSATRPPDASRGVWTIRGPAEPTADWLVSVTVRQLRPKTSDPKFRGPYPLGPFTVLGPVKQSGKLVAFAPPTARLGFKGPADFRRQDVSDDGPLAAFQFTSVPAVPPTGKPPAWLDLDARLVPAVARVRPAHALALRSDGWHWEAVVKVVPPPRSEVETVLIELPAKWETLTARPEDVVDEVQAVSDGGAVRTRLIRLSPPQKAPFELILSSRFPVAVADGKASLPLPRFPQADEREGTVSASVPEEFELRGSVGAEPLRPPANRRPPVTVVSGEWDRAAERVDLAWVPHRPDVACESRAEVVVNDHLPQKQTIVTQVMKFKTTGDGKPLRLLGPPAAIGLKSVPAVDPVAPGEWEFRPPPDAEFTLTLGYALRHPPRKAGATSGEFPIGLFAPTQVTRHDTTVRVWSALSGRRLDTFAGAGWRELPPEPAAERDILPTFTLAASGAPSLAVTWTDATDVGPAVGVDRGLILVTLADDGTAAIRGRYVLQRWPVGGVELELPADALADILVDAKRLDPQPGPPNPDADERTVRVILPDPRPGRTTALLEVRYSVPTARTSGGARVLIPPVLRQAAYRTPTRWHLTAPPGVVPLFPTADWQPDLRWGVNWLGAAPVAGFTAAEAEKWLTAGVEQEGDADPWTVPAGADAVAARQQVPDRVTVLLVPRIGWVAGVSAVAFLIGLLLSRLRSRWFGPAVAAVGVIVASGVALAPQPALQLLAAAQPGAVALLALLAGMAAWRWHRRRLIDRLPSFSRSRGSAPAVPVPPVGPSSAAGRSNRGPSAEVTLEPEVGSAR